MIAKRGLAGFRRLNGYLSGMNNNIVEERALSEIGEKFSTLRIVSPQADAAMEESIRTYGQLSPVVYVRSEVGYE